MNQNNIQLAQEIQEQLASYFDLCALYEKTPTMNGFMEHMAESYS